MITILRLSCCFHLFPFGQCLQNLVQRGAGLGFELFVLAHAHAGHLFELPGKVVNIVVAKLVGNLGEVQLVVFNEFLCFSNPEKNGVPLNGNAFIDVKHLAQSPVIFVQLVGEVIR